MPKDMVRKQIEVDGEGRMVTNENGAVIIRVERLIWSHALVGQTALMMGWPEFPGEDESLDRAHFFQAYQIAIIDVAMNAISHIKFETVINPIRFRSPHIIWYTRGA